MSVSTERQMLKDTEVAQLLGIGKSTVWRFEKTGQLPEAVRIGGATRWRKSDIDKLLTAQETHADPDSSLREDAEIAHGLAEDGHTCPSSGILGQMAA